MYVTVGNTFMGLLLEPDAIEALVAWLSSRLESTDPRRQLAEAKQDAERWKQKAEQAEARRQYDSVDAYNARINAALWSFRDE
jgi:hypothetical protein